MLRVAVYYRTNVTLRQVALLFDVSKSAAGRVVDPLSPYRTLPAKRKYSPEAVLIVDRTLAPTHDRTVGASPKNYRYSTNLQVVIDANTRLTVAVGKPFPGTRNELRDGTESGVDQPCASAHVMADSGYQGNPDVIMPYRKPADGSELPMWKDELNTVHKHVRSRVDHALAHMKRWKILRNCRRKHDGVSCAARGVALTRKLTMTDSTPAATPHAAFHAHHRYLIITGQA